MTIEELIRVLERYAWRLPDGMITEVYVVDKDGDHVCPDVYVEDDKVLIGV